MYIEQLYTNCLAEAAYFIESNGEVAIIDPLRETDQYIEMAKQRGAEIKYIFETHFHADFVSGHVDLANKTGAEIVFGPTAKTNFDCTIADDGNIFKLGNVEIEVMHTPGHTMESVVYLLKDEDGKNHSIFTGDTLFIGDVGRPDLAVKSDLTKEDLAGLLYDSLRSKIMPLEDSVMVYPAHGAGSACGKNMSSETFSTLGEQKGSNYALQDLSKEEFVKELTTGIAPPPQYFPKNVALNKNGYASMDDVLKKGSVELTPEQIEKEVLNGALLLDVRSVEAYRDGHVKGSLFIGLDGNFASWVGTLIKDIEVPIVLVVDNTRVEEAITRLSRVGYDNTIGVLKGGVKAWEDTGRVLDKVVQVCANTFRDRKDSKDIIDVRKPTEFEAGHVEGALNFPLDFINDAKSKLNLDQNYYVHCKAGYRSMVAISILKKRGFDKLIDVDGGYDAIVGADTCASKNN